MAKRKHSRRHKHHQHEHHDKASADARVLARSIHSGKRATIKASAFAVLILLVGGLYFWTSDFPMVFDDCSYMTENPLFPKDGKLPHLAGFSEFATRPARMGIDPDLATNIIMRPFAYLTLAANHALDGFNPRWFRAVNIVIHAANSVLICALLLVIFRQCRRTGESAWGSPWFIAMTAALVFAAHPLATESVTYIIQRFTSMSALFFLLALVLHFHANVIERNLHRRLVRAASAGIALLGMLAKECVFTLPLMAVLIDWLVIGTRARTAIARALPLLLLMPLIPAKLMLVSWAQNDGDWSLAKAMNLTNNFTQPISQWHYLLTQITVVADYLRQIVWPTNLNIDPDWPVHRSPLERPVLCSLALLTSITALAAWLWRKRNDDPRMRLLFVFTLWFFITISPSSSLVPLPDMKAEHRCYLPSIGIIIAIACLIDRLIAGRSWQRLAAGSAAVAVMAVSLSLATLVRNEAWRTEISLWEDAAGKSPAKFRPWSNLGVYYAEAGRTEDALRCFRKAVQAEPRYQPSQVNLATILCDQKKWHEAALTLTPLVRKNPLRLQTAPLWYLLALSYSQIGHVQNSAGILNDIVALDPDHKMLWKAEQQLARRLLAIIYLSSNQPAKALPHLRLLAAIMQEPERNEILGLMATAEAAAAQVTSNP